MARGLEAGVPQAESKLKAPAPPVAPRSSSGIRRNRGRPVHCPRRLTDKPVGYEPSIVSSNLAGGTLVLARGFARAVDARQASCDALNLSTKVAHSDAIPVGLAIPSLSGGLLNEPVCPSSERKSGQQSGR